MKKKRVSIIGTVGIPAKYGGFETLAEFLTKYLQDRFEFTVFCSGKSYNRKLEKYNGAKLIYINLNANGVQSILYDSISIIKSLRFADTLLILGVSGAILLPIVRAFWKRKIIVNIDGFEWKREKWNRIAKLFLKFSERLAVKYAHVVVSDNKVIQDYIREKYGIQSELIFYGADHATKESLSDEFVEKYPFLKYKYALMVCRIEPENNVHLVLEAFSEYKDLNLVVIGNWLNSSYGKKLRSKYTHLENIYLLDPIYDQKVLNVIRSNCYVYIHGHSVGGTNPSLVEAMYLGLPILAYKVPCNVETTEGKALYFSNKEELLKLLSSITPALLEKLSAEMQEIARRKYIWKDVCEKYAKLF